MNEHPRHSERRHRTGLMQSIASGTLTDDNFLFPPPHASPSPTPPRRAKSGSAKFFAHQRTAPSHPSVRVCPDFFVVNNRFGTLAFVILILRATVSYYASYYRRKSLGADSANHSHFNSSSCLLDAVEKKFREFFSVSQDPSSRRTVQFSRSLDSNFPALLDHDR